MAGMLYNAEKGYGTHFCAELHFGADAKNLEFVGQNMLNFANSRSTDYTYHRWWLQYKVSQHNFRIGAETEITNTKGKKATVAFGPRFSLIKGDYRLDCFYGKVVQSSGVLTTPMTIRVWLYINM